MSCFQVRTDLALEAREGIADADGELRGVRVEEYRNEKSEVNITKVTIDTRNGAKAMGKPMGTYITLEAPGLNEPDEDYHREVSEELAEQIRLLLPDEKEEKSVLVVGLGNRDVTADALGPEVVDNLFINRHVVLEYGKAAYGKEKMNLISSLVPGVTAMTGMETAEIIKGVVEQTTPDVVLVVDALAARSTKRLNRTPSQRHHQRKPGSTCHCHRCADGGGRGNHSGRCD